jgi:predicted amidohydrolase
VGANYKAAVVEFSIDQFTPNARERQTVNLNGFRDSAMRAQSQGAQIIVFPEDGINGAIFNSRDAILPYLEEIPELPQPEPTIPCTDSQFEDSFVLRTLSCLARNFSIIVVANMGERKNCTHVSSADCPPDGRYQFNTNVAFEANGALLAKYHKINLFGSEQIYFNPGKPSGCVSFVTSFGVEFGLFTCYDLLFTNPSNCLLAKGIKNYVFPTAWGNSYAFYMSIAIQQGWSRKNQVNVLQQTGIVLPICMVQAVVSTQLGLLGCTCSVVSPSHMGVVRCW